VTEVARREYAGIVSRAIAYVIDALIVTVVAAGVMVVVVSVSAVVSTQARDLARAAVPVFLILLPTVLALYSFLFWALAGRTPGMALLGVRVTAVSGRPVAWLPSLVRAVVLAYFPVGALWLLVDRRGQGLHDKLARTMVVRVKASTTGRALGPGTVRVAG